MLEESLYKDAAVLHRPAEHLVMSEDKEEWIKVNEMELC